MKKIVYLIAAGVIACGIAACQDEPKNPGDYSVEATLTTGDVVSLSTGKTYPVNIERTVDTVFYTYAVKRDTTFGPDREVISIVNDTTYTPSRYTKFYDASLITLDSPADTFSLPIKTNAKWISPVPETEATAAWLYNDATGSGGGDGKIVLRVGRNRNATRRYASYVYIFTSDSSVMYRIPFGQLGER